MQYLAPITLTAWLAMSATALAQTNVTTWHNDLARMGQNRTETILTPATLRSGAFAKECAYPVDGQIYAQPLYLQRVDHGGRAHSVVYVATEHDSVYAFDADCRRPAPLWKTSFLGPHVTTMPCTSKSQPQCDPTIMSPEHGITATPVIDPDRGVLFVDAQSVEAGVYTQKLHALDVATGIELPGSPVTIAATAPNNPKRTLDPVQAFQRSGLLLKDGIVYVPLASNDSSNGWLVGYDGSSLKQVSVFCVTPTGNLGGIWGGGAAPAADQTGSILLGTGNGSFDATTGGANFGMSAVKMRASSGDLKVEDYFTPTHEAHLSSRDLDLDSGGLMLAPDQPGDHPHEAFIGFKTGVLFVLDRDRLGHLGDERALQHLTANPQGIYSTPAYWEGSVYLAGAGGRLRQWRLRNGLLPVAPTHESANSFSYPGSTPSISSNGAKDGIVWAIASRGKVAGGGPAVLRAYDARDVSVLLYSSDAAAGDTAGPGVKFSLPTIADGRVFVGTQSELDIYGLAGR